MKNLGVMAVGLMMGYSATVARADHIATQGDGQGNTFVTVHLDLPSVFGERLFDALQKSPLVREVKNEYVKGNTRYEGDQFVISRSETSISLNLRLRGSEVKNMSTLATRSQSSLTSLSSEIGAVRALHQALLASESRHAIKKNTPRRKISREHDEVAVLETDTFGGDSLSAVPVFDRPEYSHISIELSN